MLDQIQDKIDQKLYEMSFVNISDMDSPVTFTVKNSDNSKKSHKITLTSGLYDWADKAVRGKDENGSLHYIPKRNILNVN
jgi:hypothetical protein